MIKGGAVPLFTPHSKERSSPKRTEHHSMSSFFNKFIQDFLKSFGGIDGGAQLQKNGKNQKGRKTAFTIALKKCIQIPMFKFTTLHVTTEMGFFLWKLFKQQLGTKL